MQTSAYKDKIKRLTVAGQFVEEACYNLQYDKESEILQSTRQRNKNL